MKFQKMIFALLAMACAAVTEQEVLDAFAAQLVKDGLASCKAPVIASCGSSCSGTSCGNFMINVKDGHVTNIYLAQNSLSAIPASVGTLTAVTSMSLYQNKLTAIPAEIGNMAALTALFASPLFRTERTAFYSLA